MEPRLMTTDQGGTQVTLPATAVGFVACTLVIPPLGGPGPYTGSIVVQDWQRRARTPFHHRHGQHASAACGPPDRSGVDDAAAALYDRKPAVARNGASSTTTRPGAWPDVRYPTGRRGRTLDGRRHRRRAGPVARAPDSFSSCQHIAFSDAAGSRSTCHGAFPFLAKP